MFCDHNICASSTCCKDVFKADVCLRLGSLGAEPESLQWFVWGVLSPRKKGRRIGQRKEKVSKDVSLAGDELQTDHKEALEHKAQHKVGPTWREGVHFCTTGLVRYQLCAARATSQVPGLSFRWGQRCRERAAGGHEVGETGTLAW